MRWVEVWDSQLRLLPPDLPTGWMIQLQCCFIRNNSSFFVMVFPSFETFCRFKWLYMWVWYSLLQCLALFIGAQKQRTSPCWNIVQILDLAVKVWRTVLLSDNQTFNLRGVLAVPACKALTIFSAIILRKSPKSIVPEPPSSTSAIIFLISSFFGSNPRALMATCGADKGKQGWSSCGAVIAVVIY